MPKMLLVGQVPRHVENFNIAIFSDTVYVTNVKFCIWYYLLNFTCSCHFQWSWPYFRVSAVSNSLNRTFYILILLSWISVGLLSTSTRSWLFHQVWLLHIFKGNNWYFFCFDKDFNVGLKKIKKKLGLLAV